MIQNQIMGLGKHMIALAVLFGWIALCLAPLMLVLYSDTHEVITQYWPHWFNMITLIVLLPLGLFGLLFMFCPYTWVRMQLGLHRYGKPRGGPHVQ